MSWYRTGTISVTNRQATVTGAGTAWVANAQVGEGLLAPDGRIYEIADIASNTSITLGSSYLGSSQSGQAYVVVPTQSYIRDLASQAADLLNRYSNIANTVGEGEFPNGTLANLAVKFADDPDTGFYRSASNQVTFVAGGVAQFRYGTGGLVFINQVATRAALGLGDAATRTVGTTSGNVMAVGAGGWLGRGVPYSTFASVPNVTMAFIGGMATELDGLGTNPAVLKMAGVNNDRNGYLAIGSGNPLSSRAASIAYSSENENGFTGWREILHTANTAVDGNGFIVEASPVVRLYADKAEGEGEFSKVSVGHYELTGTNGLRLGDGWYLSTPQDRNGDKYFNVEWEQDSLPSPDDGLLEDPANITITIKCYERVWNPATGLHENGDPVDILEGRWIDLRMNEVRQPESDPD